MIRSKLFIAFAFAAVLVLVGAPAWADSIPVTNASFATDSGHPFTGSFSGGLYNTSGISGWSTTPVGTSGSFQPNSTEFTSIPGGFTTVGFTNGGTISQDLTGIGVLANTIYTLSVFVGNRMDTYGAGNYTISLDAGSSTLCTFSGSSSSANITPGTFTAETCSFTSGSAIP